MPPQVKRTSKPVTTIQQPLSPIFATMLQTHSGLNKISDLLAAPVILAAGVLHAPIGDQNKQFFSGQVDTNGTPCGRIGGQYIGCRALN
jgi:hypothetical protein